MNAQEAKSKRTNSRESFSELLHPFRISHTVRNSKPFGRVTFLSFCLSIVILAFFTPLSMAQFPEQRVHSGRYKYQPPGTGDSRCDFATDGAQRLVRRHAGHA